MRPSLRPALLASGLALSVSAAASLTACSTACCPRPCDQPPVSQAAFDIVPVATLTSRDGGHRLQIEAVLRRVDEGDETTQIHARIEPWSDGLLLDDGRLEGFAEGMPPSRSKDAPIFSTQLRSDGHIVADGVPIPRGSTKFLSRKLAIDIGVVGTWRVERLRIEGPGQSGLLRCGPFAIKCYAEAHELTIVAFNTDETAADWRAYQARVPLRRIGHWWISEGGLSVRDATGVEILSGSTNGEGGATAQRYPLFGQSTDIAYPVTIEVRVPENVTMRTIEFDLKGVDVPAARTP